MYRLITGGWRRELKYWEKSEREGEEGQLLVCVSNTRGEGEEKAICMVYGKKLGERKK
jgi:hypothetical protein